MGHDIGEEEVTQAMKQWKNAVNRFNWADPNDKAIIDAIIYEYNAALARYESCLRKWKCRHEKKNIQKKLDDDLPEEQTSSVLE